jgi:LuxR family maltose regulon positive regulatory protein
LRVPYSVNDPTLNSILSVRSAFGLPGLIDVTIPLLKTKLYIPPGRPDLVSRPRLVERLEESVRLGCKLTIVCAPAGFGKTTLLSEWIAGCRTQARFAWVSLDEGDNDATLFWCYVITALQTLEPTIGQAALGALVEQERPPSLVSLLISLVNDVSTLTIDKHPYILVLDDYHILRTESIHEGLDYLLAHLPPNLRLVIASREDPPLSLSLLRGRGYLHEIRAIDLRFIPEEAGEFLNAVMGLALSENEIAALENRTEGWIAGLQMAAFSLKGQNDPEVHDFVSTFTGDDRFVADYLLDQVLHRQIPYIQLFLLQTSILNRLCGPLCDAVMANNQGRQGISPESPFSGSQQVLEYLERTGLFVTPLDNRRQWYRYHHLFVDLLRSRLQAVSEPLSAAEGEKMEIAELQLRASAWFEGEGLIAEAMDHALAAADYVRAANLIEQHYKETVWFGEFAMIFRWMEALPKAMVRSRPTLCLIYSLLTMSYSTERAEEWLQAAEVAWGARDQPMEGYTGSSALPDGDVFAANMAGIRAKIADINGVPTEELIAFTLQALEKTPERAPLLRASMFERLGWYHLILGDESAAERYFFQSKKLGENAGHFGNIIGATIGQAVIAWGHGRLHKAVAICCETLQSVVEPLERSGRRLPIAGNLTIILGRILLELYELGEAETALSKGVELAELITPIRSTDLLDGYHALACLRCIECDFEGAFAWMDRAERTCTWAREGARALRARIWLWRAQAQMDCQYLDLALAWARERNLENPTRNEWELQSLAQAYIAGYRIYGEPNLTPLLGVLDEQLRLAEAADRDDLVIYMLVLEVLARQALGQIDQAMSSLERALTLAATHGFAMTFLCHGAPMEALLREAVARRISPGYAGWLLAASSKGTPARFPVDTRPPQTSLSESLSKRELEVLRLLASSLSGPQIADELYISLGTFQTHTKNIYGKLGVHNRFEAIERARELRLV